MRALVLLLLVALPGRALADDTERARRFFRAGSIAYERGRFAEAARAFEEAYGIVDSPALAFSLAQAHRRQYFVDKDAAKLDRAIALFETYLERAPDGRRRPDAVDQLQALRIVRASVERTEAPPPPPPVTELFVYSEAVGLTVSIDGAPAVATPVVTAVAPGPHVVTAEAPGYLPGRSSIEAAPERMTPVTVTLEPKPARLTVDAEPGAEIFVDGARVGLAPLPFEVALPPGPHRIDARLNGHRLRSESVTAERDAAMTQAFDFEPTARREASHAVLITSAGLAAAGAVAVVAALVAQGEASDVDALRGERNVSSATLDDYNGDVRERNTLRTTSVVLLSSSAVLGVIGGVLFLFDDPEIAPAPRWPAPAERATPF
ncbi:MAG: PEGA domain-containing protein [Deltaproteobacteria bacterium]|jgi:hypothetical protein